MTIGVLGSFDLFGFLGWVGVTMASVIFLAVIWSGWQFFRGDLQMDDPGGSMGRQIFSRSKAERPEDWLKK